ncbi:hypothetical protein SESBI_31576 [Sesbania bispinosa]|nr:hypothetical protein SESBI_31576 [Sesbania bispinosa]
MGRPRQVLSELLDEEDQFVHRPYTKNLFSGVEQLHDLYKQDAFSSRNSRTSRSEGMFDSWDLILRPQYLPGFLITDNVSAAEGAFWPYAYRPDRVFRQFGLDQAPCDINFPFKDFGEAIRAVLFTASDALSPFDPDKFIPSSRVGQVLDVWVAYHAQLRSSVKRYEGQDSLQVFPNISLMYKDPYYVTTSCQNREKSVSEGVQSKKRKAAPVIRPKGKFSKPKTVDPSNKKACRKQKSPTPDASSTPTPPKKGIQTRSPKVKRGPAVATRASERLKPKKVVTPNSHSHPIVISDVDPLQRACAQVEGESPPPSPSARATTQGSSAEKDTHGETVDSPESNHDSTPSPDGVNDYVADSASKEGVSPLEVPSPEKVAMVDSVIPEKAAVVISSIAEKAVIVASSTDVPFIETSLGVPVPTSPHPDVEVVPILASLLPEAFLKPAYALFVDFLHFIRSHSFIELLSTYKSKVVEDMKALSLFGFQGQWFDELKHSFDRSVPLAALEDLDKINSSILSLEARNNELKTEINRLQTTLDQGEEELEMLKTKHKDVVVLVLTSTFLLTFNLFLLGFVIDFCSVCMFLLS